MSDKKTIYRGYAHITTVGSGTTPRRADIQRIDENTHRLTIHRVGEAEVQIDSSGQFNNGSWATVGKSGSPEIHRINGIAEQSDNRIKGRFKIFRNGTETAEGDFDVKKIP